MTYDFNRWRRDVVRDLKRSERPGHPDEIRVRRFNTNWGDGGFLVEGRCLGVHLGEKAFRTHADALAFAKMEARWHGAKLIDDAGRPA